MNEEMPLVRVLTGLVGPVSPEDGYIVKLPADVAHDLVRSGAAVAVNAGGRLSNCRATGPETVLASKAHETKDLL